MANFPNMTEPDPPFIPTFITVDNYNEFFDNVTDFRDQEPI